MRSEIGVIPWSKYFIPYLNGEKLDHCRMADEELGCAEVYHVHADGKTRLDPKKHGTRMLWGDVEIRPMDVSVARDIRANPERAQEIWDAYHEDKFSATERELEASGWPNR